MIKHNQVPYIGSLLLGGFAAWFAYYAHTMGFRGGPGIIYLIQPWGRLMVPIALVWSGCDVFRGQEIGSRVSIALGLVGVVLSLFAGTILSQSYEVA